MISTTYSFPPRPVTPLGILAEKLEQAVHLIEKTEIPIEISDLIDQAYQLAAGLDPYLEHATTQESAALALLAKKTRQEPWNQRFSDGETIRHLEQEMLSGHIEGQTLKLLVQMMGARRVLEIGLFTGYSALAIAEGLPIDGELIACEVDEYVAKFALNCFAISPHGEKIIVKVAPALVTMSYLAELGEQFDFVFIDADKKEYIEYFNRLLESNLLMPNAVICVDNTLFQGQPYLPAEYQTENGRAIAKFNQVVANDPRVEQVLLPLRDGLTLIRCL
ncbi:MAG: SAM-dependent methyltransferase [Oscillatoriales cyanobacterium RM2_1_1]|nr:SAM-dependent methyltransferase [Oscillatoriales cyanobacterium SM2_3_0]NJO44404.1 SAM-dependent methyltransferase [Oscillatoriales cyanobacterium RM2_1_1]